LKNDRPEKLIIKIPKWLWKIERKLGIVSSVAFCAESHRAIILLIFGGFGTILFQIYPIPIYNPFVTFLFIVLFYMVFT